MKYRVKMLEIDWDDGKGEYDVSEAPRDLEIEIEAPDAEAAVDFAMDEWGDYWGGLINGYKSVEITPLDN